MGRKKHKYQPSGEIPTKVVPDNEVDPFFHCEDLGFDWSSPLFSIYENSALPKNKISIIASSKEEVEEAKVIKQACRREGIRVTIFSDAVTESGIVSPTEELLAENFKHSSMVLCLSPAHLKDVCIRAWLSGRAVATLFPAPIDKEALRFLDAIYTFKLDRIYQVVLTAQKLKRDCRNSMALNIRSFAFSILEY